MRYYFQLNNAFVSSKLKVLILPFTHKVCQSAAFCARRDHGAAAAHLPAR